MEIGLDSGATALVKTIADKNSGKGCSFYKLSSFIFGCMSSAGSHTNSWLLLKNGDENALLHLYAEHYLGLINYGVKLCGNRELSSDCFTQVLIELWDKRERLPVVENVRSYLLTCMRHQVLKELQLLKKRHVHETASQKIAEQAEWSYEDYLVRLQSDASLRTAVQSAFEKLTERQRELLRLRFFEDLDYDAIALRCGITKRTAYNSIFDALTKLREELRSPQSNSFLFTLPHILLLMAYWAQTSH